MNVYAMSPRNTFEEHGSVLTPVDSCFNQAPVGYNTTYDPDLPPPSTNTMYDPSLPPLSTHTRSMVLDFATRGNSFGYNYPCQLLPSPSLHSPAGHSSANPGYSSANAVWVDGPAGAHRNGTHMSAGISTHPNPHHSMGLKTYNRHSYMSTGLPPHNPPHEGYLVPAQAPLPLWSLGGNGYSQHQPLRMPHMLNDGFRDFSATGQQPLQYVPSLSLSTDPLTAGNGMSQSFGQGKNFREGVLVEAHKAYTDLVTHISHIKKASHGRSSSRTMKNLIFPQAPKSLIARSSFQLHRVHQSFPGTMSPYQHHQLPLTPNSTNVLSVMPTRDPVMLPSAGIDATGRAFAGFPMGQGAVHGSDIVRVDPRGAAEKWLNMLDNLCKSDWQWKDGMLMGGCLLHSLGRYETALLWFRQILRIDDR